MIQLQAGKNQLKVKKGEPLTSGSVNVYRVRFEFSPDWAGLSRTAVFRAGGTEISILLDDAGECGIPREVLETPNVRLEAGVYGKHGQEVVLPTVWVSLGVILEGVSASAPGSAPPTPALWEQELARKQDKLTGLPGQVVGFDEHGNAAARDPPSGGGPSDHEALTGRDKPNQHPIASIENLTKELERIPLPVEALTNEELEELLQ